MLIENSHNLILNSEKKIITSLKLNMIQNSDDYDYRELYSLSESQEMTQRGISSMESLEFQDKIMTPRIVSDSDSDIERARIIEEATRVAEKLMNLQLSKINYESELRTIETRYPTRVNSPRYYNEKKEVMNRANKLLNKGYLFPSFLQNKFNWFNYLENIFSSCNNDDLVEQIQNDNKSEINPFISPRKKLNDKNIKLCKDLQITEEKNLRLSEEKKLAEEKNHYNTKSLIENKNCKDINKEKVEMDKINSEVNRKSLGKKKKEINYDSKSGLNKMNKNKIKIHNLNNNNNLDSELSFKSKSSIFDDKKKLKEISDKNNRDYIADNDVFYLEDGSGYVTFNISNIIKDNKSIKQDKDILEIKDNSSILKRNQDIEDRKINSISLDKVQLVNSLSSKKECKKKLRLLKQNQDNKETNNEGNFLNYSSNYIRGRMDYISTDVFV